MKKTTKVLGIASIIAALAFTGCASGQPAGGSSGSAAGSSSAASGAASADSNAYIQPVITDNDHNLYNGNNGFLLRCGYNTIELDEESAKKYPALNDSLKAYSKTQLEAQELSVNRVKTDPELKKNVNKDMYYSDISAIAVIRCDEDVFSIQTLSTTFFGGAHPIAGCTGTSFDTKTGKKLELTDVIKSKKDLVALVKEGLKKDFPDAEYFNLDDTMKEYEESDEIGLNWAATPSGIGIIFNAGDIAPYASGSQSVRISIKEHPELFTDKYSASKGGYIRSLLLCKDVTLDLGLTGTEMNIKVDPKYVEDNEHYEGMTVSCDNKSYTLEDCVFIDYYVDGIHTKDNRNFIYIYTRGYSDYLTTYVFEVKPGDVAYCGAVDGGIPSKYIEDASTGVGENEYVSKKAEYPLTSPDHICFQSRVDALSTYDVKRHYTINEKGLPVADGEFGEAVATITLTAKEDVKAKTVDIEKNELKDDTTIKKGDKITIYRTNGKDTVIFKKEDGSYVGLKFDSSYEFNGKPTEETFEGTIFAG